MALRNHLLQSGFSLVELTVATAIFSMGLGGLSMMLLAAIQGTSDARFQTMATAQASSLAEMILMNSDAVGHYVNPSPANPESCLHDQLCTPFDLASAHMSAWQLQLGSGLPGGKGLVCLDSTPDDGLADDPSCDGVGSPVIKVFWEESRKVDEENGGSQRVVYRLAFP